MSQGTWVLVAMVLLATAFGAYRALTDGRFRGTHRVRGVDEPPSDVAAPAPAPGTLDLPAEVSARLGDRATLLQFSSAFCAPCRATRRVLADVAAAVPGVSHVELDAEQHLDLVRRLGVTRTPTTLILDAAGREAVRAGGAPRKEEVLAGLAKAVG